MTSPRGRGRSRIRNRAEITNVAASNANAQPAPTPSTSAVASAGPANSATVVTSEVAALASCSSGSGTVCGTSPVYAGRKNASAAPKTASITTMCQISTAPVKISDGEQRVHQRPHDVGDDHHAMPRQPVGPDAAQDEERDERDGMGGEHEADVGRRPDLGHVQRERDEHEPVTDRARALPQPEQAELSLSQDVHHRSAIMPMHGGGRALRRVGARMVRA